MHIESTLSTYCFASSNVISEVVSGATKLLLLTVNPDMYSSYMRRTTKLIKSTLNRLSFTKTF